MDSWVRGLFFTTRGSSHVLPTELCAGQSFNFITLKGRKQKLKKKWTKILHKVKCYNFHWVVEIVSLCNQGFLQRFRAH
jgi:hypothetical protein